ncbi:hypothetical protein LPJ61_000680 [Coemansia biformis]|uniref:Phosphatidylglycerol/phosphatidylinositol transfer protein n=1 Tax=Coemansia biformis TaxID=1286918 RepID=A0A9W7YHW6_9FUNG|nr:hypothetical protein LPJ61_000680 [Coemansia biformis]
MRLSTFVLVALGAAQTSTAFAFGERMRLVVQEATGIFAGIEILPGSLSGGAAVAREGSGKNRTLNDIIRDVSEEEDLLNIDYVKLDPEHPKRGTAVHLNALAYVKDRIESATANIKVKYGFITLLNRNYDLCQELKTNLNRTCPVDAGPIEVNVDVDIPGFIPPGWFHLDATAWRDSDQRQLGHILADIRF